MISGNFGKYNSTKFDILRSLFKNTLELVLSSSMLQNYGFFSFVCIWFPNILQCLMRERIVFLKPLIHSSVNPVLMLALIPVTFLPGLCSVHLFHRQVGLLFILLLLLAEMRFLKSKPFWEKVLKWMLSIKMAVLPTLCSFQKQAWGRVPLPASSLSSKPLRKHRF